MNRILTSCIVATIAGMSTSAPGAPPAKSTTLPDWSGEWEMVGLTPHDGGLYVESAEQIAARCRASDVNCGSFQRAAICSADST